MKSFDWTILIKESFVSNAISIIKYLIMFPISGTRGQKGKIAESWKAEYKTENWACHTNSFQHISLTYYVHMFFKTQNLSWWWLISLLLCAGTPGIKGNPGHFAMKFINLRRPGSKPVFVVLPTENRKYTFYINNVKVTRHALQQTFDTSQLWKLFNWTLKFIIPQPALISPPEISSTAVLLCCHTGASALNHIGLNPRSTFC